jgi:hypothetical protein
VATAAEVGVQNTPPGMDAVALGQRVAGLTGQHVADAVANEKPW